MSDLTRNELEALFSLALLNTLSIEQTHEVLKSYLKLRENPTPALTALGFNKTKPEAMK